MKRADIWWKIPEVSQDCRLLDFGAGGPPAASSLRCAATFLTSDIRRYREADAEGKHAACKLITDVDTDGPVDVVLYEPAQREAKLRGFEVIDGSFRALVPGGRFYLAGRKDRGAESYRDRIREVFGNVALIGRSKRTRVYEATKNTDKSAAARIDASTTFQVTAADGRDLSFVSRAGVFSADGLDPGSRTLIDAISPLVSGRVLDLGCGAGTVGIMLASGGSDGLTMVDVNAMAAACAAENAARNGMGDRTTVLNDDLYGMLDNQTFEWVVSNPPFHEGNAVAHPLIEGAASHLSDGGRLALVVMRIEPFLKALERVFFDARILHQSQGYSVLVARNPR
jgi:16S rRNA (guanine1207-N2)-methyltransferase